MNLSDGRATRTLTRRTKREAAGIRPQAQTLPGEDSRGRRAIARRPISVFPRRVDVVAGVHVPPSADRIALEVDTILSAAARLRRLLPGGPALGVRDEVGSCG